MHFLIIVKKTGYFYGFKHGECKGKNNKITVLFHNGAKFDFRLIIAYLAEKCPNSNISCIIVMQKKFIITSNVKILKIIMIWMLKQMYYY